MSKIRGNTQIIDGTVGNAQLAGGIATAKLAEGAELFKRDGTVAMTGNLNANNHTISGLVAATQSDQAATWGQVQAVAQGLQLKAACRLATTAALAGGLTGLPTIDGQQVVAGDRILVKDEANAATNGIYTAAAGAWTRAADADGNPSSEVMPGMFTFVTEGAVNADTGWALATDGTIVIGTTNLTFIQFSSAGVVTAGTGLAKVGNALNVQVKEGVEIDGNALRVKLNGAALAQSASGLTVADGGVTDTMLAGSITTAKLADGAEFIKRDGSVAFTGDVALGNNKLTGVANGVANTDAVNLGQLTAAIEAVDVSSQIAPIQNEINAIETGAGLATDGTYVVPTGTNYLNASTSLADADLKLDTQVKANADAVALKASQIELDATQAGAGLNADGTYATPTGTNYLNSATSLTDADHKLDAQLKTVADQVAGLSGGSGVGGLQTEMDATQAAVGLNADGTLAAYTGTNYLNAAASIKAATVALDTQIKANTDGIATKSSQTEVDAIEAAVGLAADGTLAAYTGTNYLNSATTIKAATVALDTQVKTVADAAATKAAQTEVDAVETAVGLNADGTLAAYTGTNYLNAAASIKAATVALDTQVKAVSDAKVDKTAISTDSTFASANDTTVPSTKAVKDYLVGQVADNAVGFVDDEVPGGTVDGSNATFTLAGVANPPESVHLYVNGLRSAITSVTPGASSTTFVAAVAPNSGDVLSCDYRI